MTNRETVFRLADPSPAPTRRAVRFTPGTAAGTDPPCRTYRRATRYEDHLRQATEMVAEQAGVSKPKALQLLIAMSNEIGESLEHTALDVLDGIIRFDE